MVAALMFLAACQENTKMTAPEFMKPIVNEPIQLVSEKGAVPGNDVFDPGWTDQNVEAGYIFVANDAQNLYVTYYADEDWQMAEANLNISKTIQGIPVDENGIPLPGDFKYKVALLCENTYTYIIPLSEVGLKPGDDLVLASKAMVGRSDGQVGTPANICRAGDADSAWWNISQGKVKIDPNAPDRIQKINIYPVKLQMIMS
jgi:hypothetical protein